MTILEQNINLFFRTFGGMGLTGIIINVAFYLKPIESAWINQQTLVAKNIKQTIELFEKNINSTYSVAWIDCNAKGNKLGRSLVMLGEHSKKEEINPRYKLNPLKIPIKKKVSIPFFLPSFILTNLSVRIFNFLYFLNGRIS